MRNKGELKMAVCDLCHQPGNTEPVRPEAIQEALNKDVNPFSEILGNDQIDKLAAEMACDELKQRVAADNTDWNVCKACMAILETDEPLSASDAAWENRTLCSDESCIGVIGSDGCCKECGLPCENERQQPFFEEASTSNSMEPETETETSEIKEKITDLEWEQRTLCRDESCIGVIGPDGYCKECKKSLRRDL
jgi:hypothetical protein